MTQQTARTHELVQASITKSAPYRTRISHFLAQCRARARPRRRRNSRDVLVGGNALVLVVCGNVLVFVSGLCVVLVGSSALVLVHGKALVLVSGLCVVLVGGDALVVVHVNVLVLVCGTDGVHVGGDVLVLVVHGKVLVFVSGLRVVLVGGDAVVVHDNVLVLVSGKKRGRMYVPALRYAALAMVHHGVPRQTITAVIGVRSAQLERWLRYWRRSESVWRVPERQNRHEDSCWENDTLLRAIIALVQEHPLALLKEHTAMMTAMRALPSGEFAHLRVSRSTVDRVLRRLGFTRKVIIRLYRAANRERRREHAVLRQMVGSGCLVSVDETHTDGRDVLRRYGRALRQERVDMLDISPRHVERVSTTMAVSSEGRILGLHSVTCEGALTSNDWRLFLGRVIQKMGRYTPGVPWDLQAPACVLLFDNAPIHDAAGDAFLENNGIPFIRLPPYSPDLQPIEGVFNDLKVIVRNLVYFNPHFLEDGVRLQALAASLITRRQIVGQFSRVEVKLARVATGQCF